MERDAEYYRMNHASRGLALIFNHEHFDSPHLRPRAGTNADFENLNATLIHLGFLVRTYYDADYKTVQNAVEDGEFLDFFFFFVDVAFNENVTFPPDIIFFFYVVCNILLYTLYETGKKQMVQFTKNTYYKECVTILSLF